MMRVSFARRRIFTLLQAEHDNNRTNFPYWKYARFDLELLDAEKRLSDLQNKTGYHSFILCHFVGVLDTLKTLYRHIVLSVEEHCITLRRLAYPCRYGGVIPIFHDLCLAFHFLSNVFFMQGLVIFFVRWFILDFHQKTLLILQMLFIMKGVHLTTIGDSLMVLLEHIV